MRPGRKTQRSDARAVDVVRFGMGAEPAHGAFGILNLSRKSVLRGQTITDRDGDITLPGQKSGEGAMDFVRTFGPTAAVQDDHGGKRPRRIFGSEEVELQIFAASMAVDQIEFLADGMDCDWRIARPAGQRDACPASGASTQGSAAERGDKGNAEPRAQHTGEKGRQLAHR